MPGSRLLEREAELAAEGTIVTLRTMETHLTHAYPKLGIRSRRELPEALGATPR